MTDRLGTRWKISENGYKLHSCCGHTHTAIDVALELRSKQPWTSDDVMTQVAAVHIETYGPGYEIVKEANPRSPYQAKFSIAYCVAAGLLEGQVGPDQFRPERFGPGGVRERAVAELLRRTRVTVEEDLTRKYPTAWPSRVTLTLDDGSVVCGASDFPQGHPENPVSTCHLEEKLVALVGSHIDRETAERALDAMRRLDACADMADLFRDLLPGPAREQRTVSNGR